MFMKRVRVSLAALLLLAVGAIGALAQSANGDPEEHFVASMADISKLDNATADVTIDGVVQDGQTIKIKLGSIVEVQFSQLYRAKKTWWFAGVSPQFSGFFLLTDFHPPISHGQMQLEAPGKLLCKFRAGAAGTFKLLFKYGPQSKQPEYQPYAPFERTIEITVDVQ
jgi:hypothetical protein